MKILLLVDDRLDFPLAEFYQGLHKQIGSVDIHRLSLSEQSAVKNYFATHVDLSKFDRIVVQLDVDLLSKQVNFFREIEYVVFFDNNAFSREQYQAGVSEQYLKFYRRLPWARIIVANYTVMQTFHDKGLDVECIPRGYNSCYRSVNHVERDIPLLVSSASGNAMQEAFLQELLKAFPYAQLFASDDQHDEQLLKRANIVVFSDIHHGYYQDKIFAAMAAGCTVMCPNQSTYETSCLGLVDMENIVLFDDYKQFADKLALLHNTPELAAQVCANGQAYAYKHFQAFELGCQAGRAIAVPMRRIRDYRLGLSVFGMRW